MIENAEHNTEEVNVYSRKGFTILSVLFAERWFIGMKKKSFIKNSITNIIYKMINIIYPLITTAYISHVLMAENVGKVNFAMNIAQYFIFLAPLGILNYGTREIAKIRDNKKLTNEIFTELFIINFISTTICSISYYLLVSIVPRFSVNNELFLIFGFQIILNIFNIEWIYQGFEEYSYITVRSLIIKIISLFLIFAFVRHEQDYVVYCLVYVFGIAGNYILNMLHLHNYGIRFTKINLSFKKHLRPILILLCSTIAVEFYTLLDTTMVGILNGDKAVAYYTNSSRVSKIVISIVTSFSSVLLPHLSYFYAHDMQKEINNLVNIVTKVIFYLSVPLGIGLFCVADMVVMFFFGSSFTPAIETLRISTILIYVLGLSNLFGSQILLTFAKEKQLLLATVTGAIINFTLNCLFIPIYAQNGAMVASIISESVVTLMTFLFAKKYIVFKFSICEFIKIFICAAVLLMSVIVIRTIIGENSVFVLFICISVGGMVYFVCSFIFKVKILILLINLMKTRCKVF